MKAFANPLARHRAPGHLDLVEALKEGVRGLLGVSEAATISISEVGCRDRGCAEVETVIAVFSAGERTKVYRLDAAVAQITDAALRRALSVSASA